VHADELSDIGGAALAAELEASSAALARIIHEEVN